MLYLLIPVPPRRGAVPAEAEEDGGVVGEVEDRPHHRHEAGDEHHGGADVVEADPFSLEA